MKRIRAVKNVVCKFGHFIVKAVLFQYIHGTPCFLVKGKTLLCNARSSMLVQIPFACLVLQVYSAHVAAWRNIVALTLTCVPHTQTLCSLLDLETEENSGASKIVPFPFR